MIQIASLRYQDYAKLAVFLEKQNKKLNADFWLQRFKLWWEQNPAFVEGNTVRGWTILDEDKIVGFMGNIPTKFQLSGKEVFAFNGTNLSVLPEYRTRSLALFLRQINYSPIVFMTTPSDNMMPIFQAFKIPLIPRGNNIKYHRKSLIAINFKDLLKQQLSPKFRSNKITEYCLMGLEWIAAQPILGTGLINCFDLIFKKYQSHRLKIKETVPNLHVQSILKADASFDELWARTKQTCSNTNIRTADIINWHIQNGNHNMVLFGCYSNDTLVGYAIFRVETQLKKLECVDLWIDPQTKNVVEAIINFSINYSGDNGFSLILFPHFNTMLGNVYNSLGLFSIQVEERRDFFRLNSPGADEISETNSYFVGLQGDHDLW